jgi:hypothetical protein
MGPAVDETRRTRRVVAKLHPYVDVDENVIMAVAVIVNSTVDLAMDTAINVDVSPSSDMDVAVNLTVDEDVDAIWTLI